MTFRKAIETIRFKSVDHDPCMWVRDAKAATLTILIMLCLEHGLTTLLFFLVRGSSRAPSRTSRDKALITWNDDSIILFSEREFQRIVEDLKGQRIDIDKASHAEKFVGVDINISALRVETR